MKDGKPAVGAGVQLQEHGVLALNCGSSTVKFAALHRDQPRPVLVGAASALETAEATLTWEVRGQRHERTMPGGGHQQAIEALTGLLPQAGLKPAGIGHRVVHGGELFSGSARINGRVEDQIADLAPLAPLHNPANLLGIRLMRECLPGVPQVAVFDTAFHQTLPPKAYRYALPPVLYQRHRIRRYGFHGTSHQFVALETARRLERPIEDLQLITVHLGNGCSACAIQHGRSVDTTMGLTPSEGMMMGTRSGDVDPLLHQYLATNAGMSLDEITRLLNRESGLLGVSGTTNDRRLLEQQARAGDAGAKLALELFCYRAAKAILGLTAALDRVDALVFTGGIGEHSPAVRTSIVGQTVLLGRQLLPEANDANGSETEGWISRPGTPPCLVIPTNEELAIAREVWRLLDAESAGGPPH